MQKNARFWAMQKNANYAICTSPLSNLTLASKRQGRWQCGLTHMINPRRAPLTEQWMRVSGCGLCEIVELRAMTLNKPGTRCLTRWQIAEVRVIFQGWSSVLAKRWIADSQSGKKTGPFEKPTRDGHACQWVSGILTKKEASTKKRIGTGGRLRPNPRNQTPPTSLATRPWHQPPWMISELGWMAAVGEKYFWQIDSVKFQELHPKKAKNEDKN